MTEDRSDDEYGCKPRCNPSAFLWDPETKAFECNVCGLATKLVVKKKRNRFDVFFDWVIFTMGILFYIMGQFFRPEIASIPDQKWIHYQIDGLELVILFLFVRSFRK